MKTNPIDLWQYEKALSPDGKLLICGVDEAGRGPLAGPVCAAAVILPFGVEIKGLNDSKKLTDKTRRALFDTIVENAVSYGIGLADEKEIDEMNILQATFLAMHRAFDALSVKPDAVFVDGNRSPNLPCKETLIVRGDSLSANIAAASILAKVTRDRLMEQYAETYPQYGFEIHKGYGTRRHYEALTQYGASPIHRQSFLKKFYAK